MPPDEQERGFLAHIADNPFDDSVRLIYADWLEECGDPRADLIRLQIEHARVNFEYRDQEAADLSERIDELTRLHWRRWYGLIPPELQVWLKDGLLVVSVRDAQNLLPRTTVGRLLRFSRKDRQPIQEWWEQYRPWIMCLHLSESEDATVRRLADEGFLDGIPRLEIGGQRVTTESLKSLGQIASLRELSLRCTSVGEGLGHLRKLDRLHTLDLGFTRVSGSGLQHLAELSKLRWLEIDNLELRPEAARHLGQLTQLERLECYLTHLPDNSAAFLESLSNLLRLSLDCRHSNSEHLRHLTGMTQLEYLRLDSVALDETALIALRRLPALRQLSVRGTGTLSDRMDNLRHLQRLEVLDLDAVGLTAEAAEHVGTLPSLRYLRAGWMEESWDWDAGTRGVLAFTQIRSLETLAFAFMSEETIGRVANLRCLRKLVLCGSGGDDDVLERLPILSDLTDLELVLSGGGRGLSDLVRQPKLIRLRLQGKAFDIAHIAKLRSLRRLWLEKTNLSDGDLVHLQGLTELRELRLSKAPLMGTGFHYLASLPNLVRLDCSGTAVNDDSLPLLEGFPALDTLDLTATQVTDAGLAHLARLPRLRVVLLTLRLFQLGSITNRGIVALQTARPDLIVDYI